MRGGNEIPMYESLAAVLLGFDVDCCCFGFKLGESHVYTTERGLRALRYGVNIVDSCRHSPSYCRSLEKSSGRGFSIGLPGYIPDRVNSNIRNGSYVYLLKYDSSALWPKRMPLGPNACVCYIISTPQFRSLDTLVASH